MNLYLFAKTGLRSLFQRQNLAFTVIAALCLGAGIGAGVTVFSIANAVLWW